MHIHRITLNNLTETDSGKIETKLGFIIYTVKAKVVIPSSYV